MRTATPARRQRVRRPARLLAASSVATALLVPLAGPSGAAVATGSSGAAPTPSSTSFATASSSAWGAAATASGGDAVLRWNATAGQASLAACIAPTGNPLQESRMYAMTHVAVHDALNAIHRRSQPYAYRTAPRSGASPEAAVAAAASSVLVPVIQAMPTDPGCIDASVAGVRAQYAQELARIPDGKAKRAGLSLGRAAAVAVLQLRAHDGSDTLVADPNYPQGTRPGQYRFTPGFDFVFAPGWADVTPFVLRNSAQFRPGVPYAVTSSAYAADVNEIQRLGGDGVTTPSARTPDQTERAVFWDESSPLMWNRLARLGSSRKGLDLWENARLFGLLDMALADGYVASFDTKRHYSYWRPVTAIREADHDGNAATTADPTWTPLLPTPPIPDYDSAHATEGAAGAAVLRAVLGNRTRITTCSYRFAAEDSCTDATPVLRTFTSFTQAAAENGESRILVGFHFRKAVQEGLRHGTKIGDVAVQRYLRPVH
jgi:vanadium-dependent haloperoxidase-like protein